jgi:hypothetical protein
MNGAVWFSSLAGLVVLAATPAEAQPSRVIILHHAEKLNAYALCDLGRERADALAKQFLGQGATQSLFAPVQGPTAFMAVTLHPLETITPAAQTWGLPVIDYSVVPNKDEDDAAAETEINARTREAARDLMSKHEYDGKIVVVAWEHKHIASHKLEKEYRGRRDFSPIASPRPRPGILVGYELRLFLDCRLRFRQSQPGQVRGHQTDVHGAVRYDSRAGLGGRGAEAHRCGMQEVDFPPT